MLWALLRIITLQSSLSMTAKQIVVNYNGLINIPCHTVNSNEVNFLQTKCKKLAEGMLGVDIGDDYSIWRQEEKLFNLLLLTIFISSHDKMR